MEYYGFAGSILHIDLTSGSIRKEPLDLEVARKFLGGWGINHRLIYDLLAPETDPLSPDNPFIIGAGPLTGTLTPSSSKVSATTKYPNYASASEENKHIVATGMGGSSKFGFMLKNAGYDHVVITGRAERPVFLKIVNDDVEICDATDMWGKMDAYQTTDELFGRYGKCGVYAIGRAGENLVRFATGTVDGKYSLGKSGGAAVLGSKNLKAIVARGDKGIKVSDSERLIALYYKSYKDVTENPGFADAARYGMVALGAMAFLPARDWRSFYGGNWQLIDKTSVACLSCASCLTPCTAYMEVRHGEFAGLRLVRRTFPLSIRGRSNFTLEDYGAQMKIEDTIERLGLDRQYVRAMLGFVTKLYEQGAITTEDTDGLVLRRGDINSSIQLLQKIASREGDFARCLGEGWYPLSKRLGVNASDEVSICKGIFTILDARTYGLDPSRFTNITNPRVQHIHSSTTYFLGRALADIKARCEDIGMSKEAIDRAFTIEDFNIGRVTKHIEDYHSVLNSLGICTAAAELHGVFNTALLTQYYSAVTGFEISVEELKRSGERVWNLYKLLNVREGFRRKDDVIPSWWRATEIPYRDSTGTPGLLKDYWGKIVTRDRLEKMLDDYYDERGWDIMGGVPTRKKLIDLELKEFAEVVPE
jgi:aldehyde:ferredoxin oxidoreductase